MTRPAPEWAPRAVEEWWPSAAFKPQPLLSSEAGRGSPKLPPARVEELERFCARALSLGAKQAEIAIYLGSGRSRVSRWCVAGIRRYGCETDHRFLNGSDRTLVQMMWARITLGAPDDCWEWRGAIKPNGYGVLNYKGTAHNAHRLVYETLISEVPDGLVLDHRCSNPRCVNPRHLSPVTQSLNLSLGHARRA